jgi:hypothetical protein
MPMTKGKLILLLLAVTIVAVLLSGCFLPAAEDTTGPVITVKPLNPVTAGQSFTVNVSATDKSGIDHIQATFMGTTLTSQTSPASFTFTAPSNLVQAATYPLEIEAVDNSKNHNVSSKTLNVAVWPTQSGTIVTAVMLDNTTGIYLYPEGPQETGSVLFSVAVRKGVNLVKSVSVFVDGKSVSSTSTAAAVKVSDASTSTEAEYTFFYPITAEHAGPHTYYAEFYGQDGQVLQTSPSGWFYIVYPSKQNVDLSEATPLYNGSYIKGDVSFTATATDYTSNYEALLVNGTPFATLVKYPSTNILNVQAATKIVNKVYNFDINTASMTDGSYTFKFIDKSIGGGVASDTHTYIVDNTPPVLRASYQGIPSVGNKLYVGANPVTFEVYAYDTNWMSSAATLGVQPFTLTKNGTALADVSGLANDATETFTAWVKDYADHKTSLSLTIVRDTVAPTINWAKITGLSTTVSGVPYSADATITVEASVTDPNLKSVAFMLDGPHYTFPMTKNASGIWEATVDLTKVLPGTYHASVIATDLALNDSPLETMPATVNVYRPLESVFTTSLETNPSTPVNGFVKSATITVNINPDWIYAVRNVYLMNGSATADTLSGASTSTYYFTTFTGTGTYHVVVEDNVNATVTDGAMYTVNIDVTAPSSVSIDPATSVVTNTSETFTVSATDMQSGVASFELCYQTLGATGADNGAWVTADSVTGNNLSSATLTWNNINTLPDGKYNIKVVAIDGVGNTAEATGYVINDNAGKPDVAFIFPPAWTNSTSTVVKIGATVNNESDVTITATSGNAALINFGAAATTSTSYTAYPFTGTWSATFTGNNATSLATVTVFDGVNTVEATKVIGFDNVKPAIATPTAPATVAGAATFTVTVHATDNLSAIKSVAVGGFAATLASTPSTNEFGTLDGTYTAVVTAPDYTTSGPATFVVSVVDNAGNEATTSIAVYVDVTAPTITVNLVNNNGSQTITNGASETNYTSTPASFTWLITTDSGATATVKATITLEGGPFAISTSPSSTVTISASGQYVITIVATNPINHKVETFTATKTVVIDNTTPTASLTVPSTLSSATFNTAVATYTAYDVNFKAATLTINGHSLAVGSTSASTPETVALNNSVFDLASVNGATVTATLTVIDKALNSTTVVKKFYVDTIAPTMSVNKTLYKSGDVYYLDIQFSEYMQNATITHLASTDVVFDVNGVYYYLDTTATQANSYVNDMGKGLLHISQLLTTSGATTNVLPLAGNTVTITLNPTKFVDMVGNKLSNSPYTVTFQNVSSPNPINK